MITKNVWFVFIVFIVFSSCKTDSNGTITNQKDYLSFLDSDRPNKSQIEAKENFDFWNEKLTKAPNQFPYLSKLASSQNSLFGSTGNIENLKNAETYLVQLNEKTNYSKPSHLQALARNYISQHSFQEALELLLKAENIGDNLQASQKMLFDVYLELGDSEKAGAYLEKFKNFSDFDYLLRLAKWSDHNSDLDAAIKYMEKATAIAESSILKSAKIWSYTNLADFYGHSGQIDKAYNFYLKSLELDSDNSYAKKGIAWIVFSHEKNTKEAKSIINKILETHNAPDYYLLLAEIAEYEGNEKEKNKALDSYWQAINKSGYGDMYNVYSAKLYLDSNPEKALEIAKREVENRPTAMSYSLYAHSLLSIGQKEEALKILETHVIGHTTEPDALLTAAYIYKANDLNEKVKPIKKDLLDSSFEIGPLTTQQVELL